MIHNNKITSLTDKRPVAFITGGSSGIGKALAINLAKQGWNVIISGRSEERLESVSSQYGRIYPVEMDVTDKESVNRTIQAICDKYGIPDLAVLNAGDYTPMPVDHFDLELIHQLNRVNYLGVMNSLSPLLARMRESGGGQILIMSSVSGYRGLPDAAPYGATKAALINFAESIHWPLKQEGIRLRIINPGFVKTALTDQNNFKMPALITPEEAAKRIIKQLDKESFEITFPKRFTYILKVIRCLPYRIYFPLISKLTGK